MQAHGREIRTGLSIVKDEVLPIKASDRNVALFGEYREIFLGPEWFQGFQHGAQAARIGLSLIEPPKSGSVVVNTFGGFLE